MVYTLAFSPHYLHKGDSRGLVNMVSVTWLVLRACSWPAQISASVWIFESAFRNQLQVFLHVLFRVFLLKIDHAAFFPSNCRVSAHCSKMSSINLTDSFLTFNIPYPLPLAVKRPKMMIESLSQVSVNKARFTYEITHFTSSLVQAKWGWPRVD